MKNFFIKALFVLPVAMLVFNAGAQNIYKEKFTHTFSIVARDKVTGEMAVGVQSHWFSVGTMVSWGKSGVGVVATQSFVDPSYGPNGLRMMAEGKGAKEVLEQLVSQDDSKDGRQVAMLDALGNVAAFTGKNCIASANHIIGDNYSVQANMMLNDAVVPAMAKAFEENSNLQLADRVLKVLLAAQAAGGDIRGKQSAVLIVVNAKPVASPWLDKKVDIRVDDHAEPLAELQRLLNLHKAYEHLNRGDEAMTVNNMELALKEYAAAESMFPENLEMKYWKAVTLANNHRMDEACLIFKKVFSEDEHWRELTRRLPKAGLLTLSESDFARVIGL